MEAVMNTEAVTSRAQNAHDKRSLNSMLGQAKHYGYSQEVLDHYLYPRNVGRFSSTETYLIKTGWAGSPEQGSLLRLQLGLDSSGMIKETRFKAFGCGATIAAASWASEQLKGLHVEQAKSLNAQVIAKSLALPPVKMYCALLVEQAITAALSYDSKQEFK